MKNLKKWCNRIVSYLKKWNIYVGIDARRASCYSIILFPLLPNVVRCGFAGVLTIKGWEGPGNVNPLERLSTIFREVRKKDMTALLSGAVAPEHYLDRSGLLREMFSSR